MIQIVMKPEPAPIVRGEGLYRAVFNCEDLGLRIRAKNAREAERKMMIIMRHELTRKLIDFNADDFPSYERNENGKTEEGVAEAAKDSGAKDPAPPRGEA